jgi:hypothetical protein
MANHGKPHWLKLRCLLRRVFWLLGNRFHRIQIPPGRPAGRSGSRHGGADRQLWSVFASQRCWDCLDGDTGVGATRRVAAPSLWRESNHATRYCRWISRWCLGCCCRDDCRLHLFFANRPGTRAAGPDDRHGVQILGVTPGVGTFGFGVLNANRAPPTDGQSLSQRSCKAAAAEANTHGLRCRSRR